MVKFRKTISFWCEYKGSMQSSQLMLVFMHSPLPPWLLLHLQRKESTLLFIQSGECIAGTFWQRGIGVCLVTSQVGSGANADCWNVLITRSLYAQEQVHSSWYIYGIRSMSCTHACTLSWNLQLNLLSPAESRLTIMLKRLYISPTKAIHQGDTLYMQHRLLHVSLSMVWTISMGWSLSMVWSLVWEYRLVWGWWLYEDMYQDQGYASHVRYCILVRI
jgi:hypothetical protein